MTLLTMQIQVEIPPAQAGLPAPPAPPVGRSIVIEGAPGVPGQSISIPLGLADVRWLRARRAELTEQLSAATDRRESITDELEGTTGANRAGLEQQLAQVDQRIVQLESDIAQTERILTSAPTAFLAASEPPPLRESTGESDAWIAIPVFFTMFVLFPLVLAKTRHMWKGTPAPRVSPAETGRLERIEQAVEAIAVEVERVSEGQRFVTKLLSEADRRPAALPAER